MKSLLMCFLIAIIAACATAANTIRTWDFAQARDALGWAPNAAIPELRITADGLAADGTGHDPQLTVSDLDIKANLRQYVEIEMKTNASGMWQLFYTNTSEEPYGGFRGEKVTDFTPTVGGFRTYRLFPFWHTEGKIVKMRLDPLDGSSFVVRSIRVAELPESAASKGLDGWEAARDAEVTRRADRELQVRTVGPNPLLLSLPVNFAADENLWVTIEMSARGGESGQFFWASDREPGLHSTSIRVRADGKKHVYNLDMSNEGHWQGNIVAMGIAPVMAKGGEARIGLVKVGSRRGGGPELEIGYFGARDAIARAGQVGQIEAQIRNTGGADTGPITVELSVGEGVALIGCSSKRELKSLAPGERATANWEVRSPKAGPARLRLSARSDSGALAEARSEVRFAPALPEGTPSQAEYVPEPKPVSTGEYLVGCYYFPGWMTHERWSVLDDFPERRPVLGYYREGDPEVADWHIKWALEHGISFFIYDWYWTAGARMLEHALHDGLFKSRYRDRFKFCLLWANHDPPKTSSEEDTIAVTKFWIENYFKRPEYLKIDGKPVVVIFSPNRCTDDMGVEGTKRAFDRARSLCKDAGLGGLYLVACTYPNPEWVKTLERAGFDALSGYNYPNAGDKGNNVAPYDDMVTGYKEYWESIDASATIPYIPVCEPGWDSRPWHGPGARVRTGKDPAKFRKMLANAKAFEDSPGRRLAGGQKMVFIEAWNEWGEGDYIEPHREWGFGYLDAVRGVFSSAPREHIDLTPADVGLGPYELPRPSPRTAWTFDDPKAAEGFSQQHMKDYVVRDGALSGVSVSADPAFYFPETSVPAETHGQVEIRMRVTAGKEAQLFWVSGRGFFNEGKSVRFAVQPDGEYHDYRLDMSANPRWTGVIRRLRLDPTDAAGAEIQMAYVRLK